MRATRDELPILFGAEPAVIRGADWGDLRAAVVSLPAGTDNTPFLKRTHHPRTPKKGRVMPRMFLALSIVALLLVAPAIVGPGGFPVHAQQATERIAYEPVTVIGGLDLPWRSDLIMVRMHLAPGSGFPIDPGDPNTGIFLAESGTFTVLADSALSVSRAAGDVGAFTSARIAAMGADAPVREEIASGQEMTLAAGDAVHIPSGIRGEIRNDSQEPAIGLVVLIGPVTAETPPAEPSPTPIFIESMIP